MMIVPRSANLVDSDDEFSLYAVTGFKKYGQEFLHKARERRWVPRDFQFKEGGKEEERKEVEQLEKEERKLWGEALRLGRTGWGEAVMVWVHVMALRVFVETVLRYGLPLDFVCGLVKVSFPSPTFSLFPLSPYSHRHLSTTPAQLRRRTLTPSKNMSTDDASCNRQPRNSPKKQKPPSMCPTPTSAATPSGATRRARSTSRTTRPPRRRRRWAAIVDSIRLTCTMSLMLSRKGNRLYF